MTETTTDRIRRTREQVKTDLEKALAEKAVPKVGTSSSVKESDTSWLDKNRAALHNKGPRAR